MEEDPDEMLDLARDPAHADALHTMRNRLLSRLDWAAPGQFALGDFQ